MPLRGALPDDDSLQVSAPDLKQMGGREPKVRRLLSSCGLGVIPLTLLTLRAEWSLMVFSA